MPYKNPDEQRAFQRTWLKKRRAKHFKGKHCAKCGKAVSSSTADLDHKKPKRNRTGHKIWSRSDSVRKKEIAKTQILCKACHKKKTANDIRKMHESGEAFLDNLDLILGEDWLPEYDLTEDELEQEKNNLEQINDYIQDLSEILNLNLAVVSSKYKKG